MTRCSQVNRHKETIASHCFVNATPESNINHGLVLYKIVF